MENYITIGASIDKKKLLKKSFIYFISLYRIIFKYGK
jgi:hypothetical protein